MLLRFAKVVGGLRLLVSEMAPIVATSVALLSVRSAAYLVGFTLGSIVSGWLPIVALLISLTGMFGTTTNTQECDTYRAQMRAIDDANRLLISNYNQSLVSYYSALATWRSSSVYVSCQENCFSRTYYSQGNTFTDCINSCNSLFSRPFPSPPILQTYPSCSSPNCPPGKKTWVQTIWASKTGNFTDPKGCFLIAYSQEAPTLPPKIEYNPFGLPQAFLLSRAASYYLVRGDRFRGVSSTTWQNLESVQGWDRGYWQAESTDPECRGWRPGWSIKVK